MATYAELLVAAADAGLNARVRVACIVSASNIMSEAGTVTNHVNRLLWAKSVFNDTTTAGAKMMWPVVALNRTATLAQMTGADDPTVQVAVDSAVNVFANGLA